MAVLTNSYGDTSEIAALTPRHADNGTFTQTTQPTLLQVESWCDQVSSVVNTMLAKHGFTTFPIADADVKLMLDYFINEEVAAIVEGVNGSGRFGPTAKRGGSKGRWAVIVEDVRDFIDEFALGIERLGETRPTDPMAGIAYRGQDEGGTDTFPIFQRDGFGNKFIEWDK